MSTSRSFQGYTVEIRFQDSELDFTTFAQTPFLDKVRQVKLLEIEILPLSAVAVELWQIFVKFGLAFLAPFGYPQYRWLHARSSILF